MRTAWVRVQENLGSHDVGRVINGAIFGLALVVALQDHPPTATEATGAVLATALAVGLADFYSDAITAEARARRPVDRHELRVLVRSAGAVMFGAGFPAIFFILAAAHAIEVATAFSLAKWTGLGLCCAYGFVAARLAGASLTRSFAHALAVAAIGGLVVGLKALVFH
jgi:hypothetical protein